MNMMCPHCKADLEVTDEYRGQAVKCPQCSKMFDIPIPVTQSRSPVALIVALSLTSLLLAVTAGMWLVSAHSVRRLTATNRALLARIDAVGVNSFSAGTNASAPARNDAAQDQAYVRLNSQDGAQSSGRAELKTLTGSLVRLSGRVAVNKDTGKVNDGPGLMQITFFLRWGLLLDGTSDDYVFLRVKDEGAFSQAVFNAPEPVTTNWYGSKVFGCGAIEFVSSAHDNVKHAVTGTFVTPTDDYEKEVTRRAETILWPLLEVESIKPVAAIRSSTQP